MFLTKKDHGEELFVLPIDYKFVLILFSTFLIMYGKRMEREREREKLFEYYKGRNAIQKKRREGGGRKEETLEKLTRPLFILERNFS